MLSCAMLENNPVIPFGAPEDAGLEGGGEYEGAGLGEYECAGAFSTWDLGVGPNDWTNPTFLLSW